MDHLLCAAKGLGVSYNTLATALSSVTLQSLKRGASSMTIPVIFLDPEGCEQSVQTLAKVCL